MITRSKYDFGKKYQKMEVLNHHIPTQMHVTEYF